MISTPRVEATSFAFWWRLSLLGLAGTVSLTLVPFEQLVPVPIDATLLRLLALIQPSLLVLLAAALGVWAAPRVGLDAPVIRAWAEQRPWLPALRPQIMPALLGAVAIAAILVVFWLFGASQPFGSPLLTFEVPLVTKLLYGGIVEELLLRWGFMSLLAWAAWRIGGAGRPVPAACVWIALVASALLFAVGHLPVLYLLLPGAPAWVTPLVLAANAVPGMMLGWLFWRRGLEAAIIAHAMAHLFAVLALSIL
jgi:membrane protease YdiL (CAAX protease family)